MSKRTWLGALGIVAAAIFATGCESQRRGHVQTEAKGKPLLLGAPMPGVVEIYRGNTLVGYTSLDPVQPTMFSWWLLNGDETAPVIPSSSAPGDNVTWKRIKDTPYMDGQMLCDHYWMNLTNPEIWDSAQYDEEVCVHRQVGAHH